MSETQIKETLTEKRRVDKENLELEYKIQGRGVTEADTKAKHFETKWRSSLERALLWAQADVLLQAAGKAVTGRSVIDRTEALGRS